MKAMRCESFTLAWKVRWWWASKPPEPCSADGAIATARALLAMPAEYRGSAARDGPEHFPLGPVNPAAVVLDEAIALRANDIGHLEEWPSHFFLSLRERLTPSRPETSRVSSGLGTACRCLCERCR